MKKQEYFSLSQVAQILGITRIAVYKKVKNDRLKAIRIGRAYAVHKKDIPLPAKASDKSKRGRR